MKTAIICASHTVDRLPQDTGCLPVMAGAILLNSPVPADRLRDDTGDNISLKNREYSELTALYWAWKNLDADNLGLCHYRRYFASALRKGAFLHPDEAEYLLDCFDVLLPSERNYIFESNLTQYINSHHEADLNMTRMIIIERHPEYLEAFDRRMSMSKGHRFNMFIMKKSLADEYCEWLFDILFELENRLDITGYKGRDRRAFGLVSERLLDVWIDEKRLHTTDLDYIFIGREHLAYKAAAMTVRKIKAFIKKASKPVRQTQ